MIFAVTIIPFIKYLHTACLIAMVKPMFKMNLDSETGFLSACEWGQQIAKEWRVDE